MIWELRWLLKNKEKPTESLQILLVSSGTHHPDTLNLWHFIRQLSEWFIDFRGTSFPQELLLFIINFHYNAVAGKLIIARLICPAKRFGKRGTRAWSVSTRLVIKSYRGTFLKASRRVERLITRSESTTHPTESVTDKTPPRALLSVPSNFTRQIHTDERICPS